ncbi:hypothetical protein GVX82_03905 [Patescibacteria group bacterium]|jgi:fatty acid desaturase|nr:hypothetical protein [Patescibacteria group bacterium]
MQLTTALTNWLFRTQNVAYAQGDPSLEYFRVLGLQSITVLDIFIGVIVTLALLLFFWGVALFIFNAGDDTKRAEGKKRMIWGIIALFVIFAIWGIIALLCQITGIPCGGEDLAAPGMPYPDPAADLDIP